MKPLVTVFVPNGYKTHHNEYTKGVIDFKSFTNTENSSSFPFLARLPGSVCILCKNGFRLLKPFSARRTGRGRLGQALRAKCPVLPVKPYFFQAYGPITAAAPIAISFPSVWFGHQGDLLRFLGGMGSDRKPAQRSMSIFASMARKTSYQARPGGDRHGDRRCNSSNGDIFQPVYFS